LKPAPVTTEFQPMDDFDDEHDDIDNLSDEELSKRVQRLRREKPEASAEFDRQYGWQIEAIAGVLKRRFAERDARIDQLEEWIRVLEEHAESEASRVGSKF
jgi:hypothetical protein